MKKTFDKIIQRRITTVLLFFLAALLVLIGRLFILQIINHSEYQKLASQQHEVAGDLLPERGLIYAQDKNKFLIPLALNRIQKTLVVSPRNIENPVAAAELLARKLNLVKDVLLEKLTKPNDAYEVIAKNLDVKVTEELEAELFPGMFFQEDRRRIYPHDYLAAHLLGFVSIENQEEVGRYGLERYYDENLAGHLGFFRGAKDSTGFLITLGRKILRPPTNGDNIILTVDYNIQVKSEEVLARTMEKWGATSGTVLVLEPETGKILAQAARPSFNPNEFSKISNYSIFLNPLAESIYELGSVVKPLTMAAAVETGAVRPDTTYVDTGEVKIGGYTIRNFDLKAYDVQTMTQVLEKSLNTGLVFVSRQLGKEKQYAYLKKFGLGERTGVDLPGEVAGNISNLNAGREVDYATASFGQGIAMSPLQLASAIAAIANSGKLMKPYIVDTIKDDSGNEFRNQPEVRREVISPETAETLTKMLVSAVNKGFENKAGIKGYFVAGKTGTAQIPRKDGRGYSDKVIHSFVGYAPAFDPRFLVYLQINEPQGNRFAANTLTPAFHDLAEYILNYYEVPPDEK